VQVVVVEIEIEVRRDAVGHDQVMRLVAAERHGARAADDDGDRQGDRYARDGDRRSHRRGGCVPAS
jgi:hypothetical protein